MENWNGAALKREAYSRLSGTQSIKIAALHTGVTLGVALVLTLLQYFLTEGIDQTGGLSGMGLRSILQTGQVLMQWANTLLVPFWSLGFLYVALGWWRGQKAQPADLLTGFRRFGPYLRLLLLKGVGLFVLLITCANISSMLYMLTPSAMYFVELTESMGMNTASVNALLNEMTDAQMQEMMLMLRPMLVIWAIMSIALVVPIFYRVRLAEYVLLDRPGTGAFAALLTSIKMTRRRCVNLLGLDLRFWWYYLLQTVCMCLCYGDMLLSLADVELPVDGTVLFFGSYFLYLAAHFTVVTLFRPRVEITYAAAYDILKDFAPQVKNLPAEPRKMPWDEQ